MKAHFLDSDEPLIAGRDYIAHCGRNVSKAAFVMFLDWQRQGSFGIDSENTLMFCSDCLTAPFGRRYVYGLIDGEKTKHLGDGE